MGVTVSGRRAVVVALTLASALAVAAGCGSGPGAPQKPHQATHALVAGTTNELDVKAENAKAGTASWRIAAGHVGSPTDVSGYTDHVSIVTGQSFNLYLTTTKSPLSAVAFRMGYYHGTGGRQVWRSGSLAARRQVAQSYTTSTRTIVCRWSSTATVTASNWPPGVYLIKLTAGLGSESRSRYVPMIVRSKSTAGRVVIMPSTFTWLAYNDFGGLSAYHGTNGSRASRAYAVSFLRPNTWGTGTGKFSGYERPIVALAEQLGLPLAYESDFDLTTVSGILSGSRAVVVMGHAEYWSVPQRNAVEYARNHGTNLIFFGANTAYWRVRLASSRHTMVIYKSTADPVYPAADTTTLWRSAPHARPERRLVGLQYNCYPATGTFRVASPSFWGFAGTGVRSGSTFGGIVAIEIDKAVKAADVPRPLQVVASSPAKCGTTSTHSSMSYYTNAAGAGVVTVGSMGWVLRGFSSHVTASARAFVLRVSTNLLLEAARGRLGQLHKATDNLSVYG